MITNKHEPTINTKQIEIKPFLDKPNSKEFFNDKYGSTLYDIGKKPLVYYNGIVIAPEFINNFYLDSTGIFPILNLYFKDTSNEMHNNIMALDNTIISIYIDSLSKDKSMIETLSSIRMDFKIVDYAYIDDTKLFYIQGIPDIDGLYIHDINYYNNTSYNTLKSLAKDINLGFRSNINDTSDKMDWLNNNNTNYSFIKYVTNYSYKNDNSFFTSYIDYNYYLNFINVEEVFNSNMNTDGVYTKGYDGIAESDQYIQELFIVNESHYETTDNNIYESFEFLNSSTKISINEGYRKIIHYYDRTGNWDQKAGTFFRFSLESNTDNKGIVLKSYPNDTQNDGFYKRHTKTVTMPPMDIDNVHKNYNFAYHINDFNLKNINKMRIKVTMRKPNFNLYKYQKIKTFVMNTNTGSTDIFNNRLSGGWIIQAINYYYDINGLKQELIMCKRELSDGDFTF